MEVDLSLETSFSNTTASPDIVEAMKLKKQKRPPNAFLLFCIENRPKIQNEHSELTNIRVSRILGEKWKELSEEGQKPYKEKAREAQIRFKEENPEYKYKIKPKKEDRIGEIESKLLVDLPDIQTLLNLSNDDLRTYFSCLHAQILLGQAHNNPSLFSSYTNSLLDITTVIDTDNSETPDRTNLYSQNDDHSNPLFIHGENIPGHP